MSAMEKPQPGSLRASMMGPHEIQVTSAPAAKPAGGMLWLFSKATGPTNHDMILFRTLNRDLGEPNANEDFLAFAIREELIPFRHWCLKYVPFCKQQTRRTLENPWWGVPGCINFVDARTTWFDGAVRQALNSGIQQVVLIAAGFDTRAYRFSAPGITFLEVDLPVASERKKNLIQKLQLARSPDSRPVYVGADLSKMDLRQALAGTTFDFTKRSLFTMEGLIYYLPDSAVHGLLSSISALSAPGSRLYFDFLHAAALQGRAKYAGYKVTEQSVANKGEPFMSAIEDNAAAVRAVVAQHGFSLTRYLSPRDMIAHALPHLSDSYNVRKPPIASFYSYAQCEKQGSTSTPATPLRKAPSASAPDIPAPPPSAAAPAAAPTAAAVPPAPPAALLPQLPTGGATPLPPASGAAAEPKVVAEDHPAKGAVTGGAGVAALPIGAVSPGVPPAAVGQQGAAAAKAGGAGAVEGGATVRDATPAAEVPPVASSTEAVGSGGVVSKAAPVTVA